MTTTLHQRGRGRPFLFQHGLCGDARQTFEAAPDTPGWQLVTLDCPGHGKAPFARPASIAHFADRVLQVLPDLPGPVVLGGISMGAAIALRLAVRHPDLICGLVLVRPAWGTGAAPVNMEPNAVAGRMIAAGQSAADFRDSATGRALALTSPDNLATLMGLFDRAPLQETAELLTMISADGPGIAPHDLAALRMPTLVCGCALDAIHPLGLARELSVAIPGAARVELPPKGTDKPAHLAALHGAIGAFLQDL